MFLPVEFTINPDVDPWGHQGPKNAHLAHLYLAQSPIVLAACSSAAITSFFVRAFIDDEYRPDLEFGMLLDIVLNGCNQFPPRPRRFADEVLHILFRHVRFSTYVGHVSLGFHP